MKPLAPPAAGQLLAVRTERRDAPDLTRTWTISGVDFERRRYRVSIKDVPGGKASAHFHRIIAVGDTVWARPPAGQFVLDRSGFRRVCLISAGIGVTPMLSMLGAHVARGDNAPPLLWLQVVKNGRHHPFKEEVATLLAKGRKVERHVFYTQPSPEDREGVDFDHAGRPFPEALVEILGKAYPISPFGREVSMPGKETEFYLCGPEAFSATVRSCLTQIGVKPALIRSEAFGSPARGSSTTAASVERAVVHFERSGIFADWHADDGLSLLDLAEKAGLSPPFACRSGVCQSCQCKLVSGDVDYDPTPIDMPVAGTVLVCCARPAGTLLTLDL